MNADDPLIAECRQLIDAMVDGDLDPRQLARLEELVCTQADCRALYVRQLHLHAGLRHYLAGGVASWPTPENASESATGAADVGPPRAAPVPPAVLPVLPFPSLGSFGMLIAVAAMLAAIAGTSWWLWRGAVPAQPAAPMVASDSKVSEPSLQAAPILKPGEAPLAAVVAGSDAQLETANARLAAGTTFGPGLVRIASGRLFLMFRTGVFAMIRGPAGLELIDERRVRLAGGEMTVSVPKAAIGFTIDSEVARVIDLGTRFGVNVAADGQTDVSVYEGQVEVEPLTSDVARPRRVMAQTAVRMKKGRDSDWQLLRSVPTPDQELLLARIAALVPRWGPVFSDSFDGAQFDPLLWRVQIEGIKDGSPSVAAKDGRAIFVDRGYLVTRDEFDPLALGGIRIRGRWRLASPDDALSIVTRSDAVPEPPYCHCRRGLEFGIVAGEEKNFIAILGHADVVAAYHSAPMDLKVGDVLDFEVIDTREASSFTVRTADGRSEAVVSTVAVPAPGKNFVVLHNRNRQRLPKVSHLEEITIERPAQGVAPAADDPSEGGAAP